MADSTFNFKKPNSYEKALTINIITSFLRSYQPRGRTSRIALFLQLPYGRTYEQVFDSVSRGLFKARIPYGVLSNRVLGFGAFTEKDTLHSRHDILQVWFDMEHSAYAQQA